MASYQPDHYRLLGVAPTADNGAIKESYRRLSRVFHPDLQGGSRAATVRFQQIATAYAELSDPTRREHYDRLLLLRDPLRFVEDPRAERALDVLDDVVTRLRRRKDRLPGTARARDLRVRHELSWTQAALGGEVAVVAEYLGSCSTCRGEGTLEPARNPTCHICGGEGRLRTGLRRKTADCAFCDGHGLVMLAPCPQCEGRGQALTRREVTLQVPPRCRDGAILRVRGAGEKAREGAPVGDLVVEVAVAAHPLFEREGDDVLCPLPLTWTEAIAGGSVQVPTLTGSETLRLPAGLAPRQEIRVAGHGLPRPGGRGDMRYRVLIDAPSGLSSAERAGALHAVALIPDAAFERRAAFDAVVAVAATSTASDQTPDTENVL